MTKIVDGQHAALALQAATETLENTDREAILDFSSVRRVDSTTLLAIEEFARVADEKAVKVVLRGVNIAVYKTLKLVKLTRRFSFAN